jgi:hypothetical protein
MARPVPAKGRQALPVESVKRIFGTRDTCTGRIRPPVHQVVFVENAHTVTFLSTPIPSMYRSRNTDSQRCQYLDI